MWGPPKAVGLWPWNSETNWSLQHASVEVAQNTWLVKIVCSGWLLWTLTFAAHKSQSRCEDCNMIPANTWPSWLLSVQCLLSSFWQWKHTEICRQLPLVQPLVSLVALSDWNQVWIGWPGTSDKLFNTLELAGQRCKLRQRIPVSLLAYIPNKVLSYVVLLPSSRMNGHFLIIGSYTSRVGDITSPCLRP